MSQEQSQARPDAQAGPSGEAAGVGSAVGGGRSKRAASGHDESGKITPEHLVWLQARRRASAGSQACQRSEGQGDEASPTTRKPRADGSMRYRRNSRPRSIGPVRRISDGSVLRLIKMWLRAPVQERG